MRAELDVEPSRETVVLCERIRDERVAGEVALSTHARRRSLDPRGSSSRPAKGQRVSAFVGREGELAGLDAQLEATLQGQGRVAFVVGEAGAGKTALLAEFAARAMQRHGDLAVALGSCDAQTGLGDPHLPFREVLQMLTGDVEAKRASENITPEHARRLWALLPEALQTLLEAGPGLVDLLVPGAALLARVQALGPGQPTAVFTAQLETLPLHGSRLPGALPGQANLFEQVTRFLRQLARRKPLLLNLDDSAVGRRRLD